MADTMLAMMDYRLVDVLTADQLEVNDLIGYGDEVVEIISKAPIKNGFALVIKNDFDEKDEIEIGDDEQFELFIYA
jgi:hypothetical protein